MKAWLLTIIMFSSLVQAQEQLAVRVNAKGMLNIMQLALKYNTGVTGSRTVIIPKNIYKFTLKQKDLSSNPIVRIMTQISDLSLDKDLDFYLNASDIKVTGVADTKSLVTKLSNPRPDGFDLSLSINLNNLKVNAPELSVCEDRMVSTKKCGPGLKASIKNLSILVLNKPIVLKTSLRVSTKNGLASVKVLSVNSNLDSEFPPTLDIGPKLELEVPKISIVIDDQETELDTSRLKDQILAKKDFLAKKLLMFAGDFIANDLAEMINIYLNRQVLSTNIDIYNQTGARTYTERDSEIEDLEESPIFVRNPVVFAPRPQYAPAKFPFQGPKPSDAVMKVLMTQLAEVIKQAKIGLGVNSLKTSPNQDIEVGGSLNLVLNHKKIVVGNTLGNSSRTLPPLVLPADNQNDVTLVISEPVINGALDLANSTGLFQEIFEGIAKMDELALKSLKVHFTKTNSLKAIANVEVDLKKVRTSFKKDPRGWLETGLGVWLERNNNNSVIYFPLEIELIPEIVKNPVTKGISLKLKMKSIFNGEDLLNTFNYPSNVGETYKIVRKAVLKRFHEQLDQYADKTFEVDLSKFLNQSGVTFIPKSISFNQGAYLLMSVDIWDVQFNSKKPVIK